MFGFAGRFAGFGFERFHCSRLYPSYGWKTKKPSRLYLLFHIKEFKNGSMNCYWECVMPYTEITILSYIIRSHKLFVNSKETWSRSLYLCSNGSGSVKICKDWRRSEERLLETSLVTFLTTIRFDSVCFQSNCALVVLSFQEHYLHTCLPEFCHLFI